MNSSNKGERRRCPRIKREVPLKIRYDDYELVGQTHDISCIGAYCTVNKYIQPFSLISIILLLPLRIKNRSNILNIRCQGVVVRSEENQQNAKNYNIAIYFNRLKNSDKIKAADAVLRSSKHFLSREPGDTILIFQLQTIRGQQITLNVNKNVDESELSAEIPDAIDINSEDEENRE